MALWGPYVDPMGPYVGHRRLCASEQFTFFRGAEEAVQGLLDQPEAVRVNRGGAAPREKRVAAELRRCGVTKSA